MTSSRATSGGGTTRTMGVATTMALLSSLTTVFANNRGLASAAVLSQGGVDHAYPAAPCRLHEAVLGTSAPHALHSLFLLRFRIGCLFVLFR